MKLLIRRMVSVLTILLSVAFISLLVRHAPESAASELSIPLLLRTAVLSLSFAALEGVVILAISALLLRFDTERFNDIIDLLLSLCLPLGTVTSMLVCLTPTQFGIVSGLFSFTILFSLMMPKDGNQLLKQAFHSLRNNRSEHNHSNHKDQPKK